MPAKTTVEVPGSTVPAVYVQPLPVRIVPARVSVPAGLSMTTAGRVPAAVVAAPVNVWSAVPLTSSVPVPPSNVEAWLIGPRAATVPVAIEPSVRVSVPSTVRVVPAATVLAPVPVNTTSVRAWLPVIVGVPAKTTVEVPGSTVPAVYVQPLPVRIVPARVSVPAGLSMTTAGRVPAAVVAAPVNVWSAVPTDEQRARAAVERRGLADRAQGGDRARGDRAVGQRERAVDGQGRARGDGLGAAAGEHDVGQGVAAGDRRGAREDDRRGARVERVPAVYVQPLPVRIVPARVSVPAGLSMTTAGRVPAAVVAAPVNVWSAVPTTSSVPLPPSNVEAWLIAPRAATVPVAIEPSVSVSVPSTVRVVPAAMVLAPLPVNTTSVRAWLPVIVGVPAKTTVEVPGSSASRRCTSSRCRSGSCPPG